jgi:hypothetical protein
MKLGSTLLGLLPGLGRRQAEQPSESQTAVTAERMPVVERRASPRRYGDPVPVKIRSAGYYQLPHDLSGWVMDRSQGGLGIALSEPLDVGFWLSVRHSAVGDDLPWARLQVQSCRPQAGRYILGCQYLEPPAQDAVLLFR